MIYCILVDCLDVYLDVNVFVIVLLVVVVFDVLMVVFNEFLEFDFVKLLIDWGFFNCL